MKKRRWPKNPTRTQRAVMKMGRFYFEEVSRNIDSVAIPGVRDKQDKWARGYLRRANDVSEALGEKRKVYLRLNHKGRVERIRP